MTFYFDGLHTPDLLWIQPGGIWIYGSWLRKDLFRSTQWATTASRVWSMAISKSTEVFASNRNEPDVPGSPTVPETDSLPDASDISCSNDNYLYMMLYRLYQTHANSSRRRKKQVLSRVKVVSPRKLLFTCLVVEAEQAGLSANLTLSFSSHRLMIHLCR